MSERKYFPSFAELVDRMGIVQLKIINVPTNGNSSAFEQEMSEILHDIQLFIDDSVIITADVIRAIVVLTQANLAIWSNEDEIRKGKHQMSTSEVAEALTYTHKLNGTRSIAKTQIQNLIGGRTDAKINCLAENSAWDIKWDINW